MTEFLPPALRPGAPMSNPLLLPPLTLAYVGDAVYELYIRRRLLAQGHVRVGDLHRTAVRYVRAKAQAAAVAEIMPMLSPEEQDVVRRGRNAKGHAAPRSADAAEYAAATAFEALAGYLYLAGRFDRLEEVLAASARYLETEEGAPRSPVSS
jgi:ribonuclease-3 family protein